LGSTGVSHHGHSILKREYSCIQNVSIVMKKRLSEDFAVESGHASHFTFMKKGDTSKKMVYLLNGPHKVLDQKSIVNF
jgi:hypothetical protein